jgi:hypothetical protein
MSRFTTCGLIILLAFASTALAVDGTVLINQSTITNGLTGCPTGGHFPIIICQSGSYRLSGNLTVPDVNTGAINITADNVTLDLNGFSLLGPMVCSGSPVTCTRSSGAPSGTGISSSNANIVVTNGQVKGMGFNGIVLTGPRSRVQNVQATNNSNDGIIVADNSLVSSCSLDSNRGAGITAGGSSVVLTGNLVSHSFVGIISGKQAALISGNSVVSNGVGIQVVCPSLISGNVVSLNADNSQLFDTSGNLVADGNLGALGSVSGCVLANNAP